MKVFKVYCLVFRIRGSARLSQRQRSINWSTSALTSSLRDPSSRSPCHRVGHRLKVIMLNSCSVLWLSSLSTLNASCGTNFMALLTAKFWPCVRHSSFTVQGTSCVEQKIRMPRKLKYIMHQQNILAHLWNMC